MKKISIILLIMLCLSACGHSKGSLHNGTYQDDVWIQDINENINDQSWDMVLLNDKNIDETSLYEMYRLSTSNVKSYAVHTAVLLSEPVEIAVFESKDEDMHRIEQGVQFHIDQLKQRFQAFPEHIAMIDACVKRSVGNYYVLIISRDATKILEYMTLD